MSGADGYVFRAGDIVHHEPTGEDWLVAYVDGENIAWCGWPAGEARAADCWLKTSCSDEEHLRWLREIAKSDGKRARMAMRELEKLGVSA
ncbi:hypothetical protein JQ594_15395 [Bradyrhizobium manausense]|uniref:hypothetical protein n=1 Tax=Bradyrhizobium manausense TaxID=989370 RepID=UPI001BA73380|nr:hypothetical protein [Bradyrhizobium manausense]MBR0687315.1 hypothetical protein [Bradyrhizobium manausense]